MEMSSERRACISVAVVKPMGTSLEAEWLLARSMLRKRDQIRAPSVRILVAFCSDMPLMVSSIFFGLQTSQHRYRLEMCTVNVRICHRLDRIEPAIYEELNVSFRESSYALYTSASRHKVRAGCIPQVRPAGWARQVRLRAHPRSQIATVPPLRSLCV